MKKVLFFDDDEVVTRYLIQNLKENFGWNRNREITFVSSSDELLDEIMNNIDNYCLFVLDVIAQIPSNAPRGFFSQEDRNKMEDGLCTGFVMAEKIRKKIENAPILFLTVTARSFLQQFSFGQDNTGYLKKPASPEEISNKMHELLGE